MSRIFLVMLSVFILWVAGSFQPIWIIPASTYGLVIGVWSGVGVLVLDNKIGSFSLVEITPANLVSKYFKAAFLVIVWPAAFLVSK